MKRVIFFRIMFFILTILVFAIIFCFSSQDGTESKNVSKGVMKLIVMVCPGTKNLDVTTQDEIIETSQPLIRKMAHFIIYMAAGFCIMGFLLTYDKEWKKIFFATIIVGMLYAISDEIHQGITGGGRTPRVFDVFVDTLGVIVGSFIITLMFKIIKKFRLNAKSC